MELLTFEDAAAWEAWLADHYELRGGVWLKLAKKGSGRASVTPTEALDVALCYGWIDSQRRALDETYFVQRYSHRRPKSAWSKVNVARVRSLVAARRTREPGLAEVRAAKADGRRSAAYDSPRNATIPPDLVAALDRNDRARIAFERLGRSERYAVMLRLSKARTPAQRTARLQHTLAALETGANTQ